jgi:hypothetical protein
MISITKYLFPFRDIPKNSKVAIYGAGNVCSQILDDFKDTAYCNIVCIADSNKAGQTVNSIDVVSPEQLLSLSASEYDYILIAVVTGKNQEEMYEFLKRNNILQSKIIKYKSHYYRNLRTEHLTSSMAINDPDTPDTFRVAFIPYGAMGDNLLLVPLVKAFRKTAHKDLILDVFTSPSLSKDLKIPFGALIDNIFDASQMSPYKNDVRYDAILKEQYLWQPGVIDYEKANKFSSVLRDWLVSERDIANKFSPADFFDQRHNLRNFRDYGRLFGANRVELSNISKLLPYDRRSPLFFEIDPAGFSIFDAYPELSRPYITVADKVVDGFPFS